jgi:hypothetical protein
MRTKQEQTIALERVRRVVMHCYPPIVPGHVDGDGVGRSLGTFALFHLCLNQHRLFAPFVAIVAGQDHLL